MRRSMSAAPSTIIASATSPRSSPTWCLAAGSRWPPTPVLTSAPIASISPRSPACCRPLSLNGTPAVAPSSFMPPIGSSGLTLEEFEGPRYQRIGHIQKLIADGVLAADLRHRRAVAA